MCASVCAQFFVHEVEFKTFLVTVVIFFCCVTYDKIHLKSGYCDGGNARRCEGDAAGQADGEGIQSTRCARQGGWGVRMRRRVRQCLAALDRI